jgi:hypothetical protein
MHYNKQTMIDNNREKVGLSRRFKKHLPGALGRLTIKGLLQILASRFPKWPFQK